MILGIGLWTFLRAVLFGSAAIALENMALRHQLAVLQRSVPRPRLARWDRIFWFWVWLSHLWAGWRSSLAIVQPATVLAWHRQGFQLYWRWKSRTNRVGRPPLDAELRQLIRRMARENPTWGRRRIQAELAFLGYDVAELTVAKYMRRTARRPSPTWGTFLAAHLRDMVAVDFFLVPTSPSASSSSSSSCGMTAANSSTSTSRTIPPQSGPLGKSSRRSRTTRRRGISCAIEMRSTTRCSPSESRAWAFARSSSPPGRRGRIPSGSG